MSNQLHAFHACLDKMKIRYPGSPQPIQLKQLIELDDFHKLLTSSYPRLDTVSSPGGGGIQFIPELDPSVKGHLFLKPDQLDEDVKKIHKEVRKGRINEQTHEHTNKQQTNKVKNK